MALRLCKGRDHAVHAGSEMVLSDSMGVLGLTSCESTNVNIDFWRFLPAEKDIIY